MFVFSYYLLPSLPERLEGLVELRLDFLRSLNLDADKLMRSVAK